MATVTKPIALDESLHTTEQTPRNLADVLAQALQILNTTISGLNFINCVVVPSLPTTGISTTTIYLVPKSPTQQDNIYDEYINLDGTVNGWEKIGDTEIDLSNYYTKTQTDTLLNGKVDTVAGKGLSTNDYTDAEKSKLAGIEANAEVNVQSDWSQADSSADDYIKNKPSNLVQDASYVHTDNNFTTAEKTKLGGIESGAEVNVQSDWNEADNTKDDFIKNKPSSEAKSATDTFTTVNGGLLEECNIELDPVQDLHGYDHPWVGGAEKNKLPLPTAETQNGVTLIHNADGSVTLTGTATATTYFDFFAGDFDSTTYEGYIFRADSQYTSWGGTTIVFRISGSDRVALQNFEGNTDNSIRDNGSGLYFAIRVANGFAIPSGGITIYPMLRNSTETADFAPYKNICPISGHTEVDLQRDGKNLCPTNGGTYGTIIYTAMPDGSIDINGTTETDSTIYLCNDERYNGLTGQFVFSRNSLSVTGTYLIQITVRSIADNSITQRIQLDGNITKNAFTISNTEYMASILLRMEAGSSASHAKLYLQLERGTEPTNFEPYLGHLYQVQIGSTVYGGYVDLVSGSGKSKYIAIDLSAQSWSYNSASDRKWFTCTINDVKATPSSSVVADMLCSCYKPTYRNYLTDNPSADSLIAINPTKSVIIRDLRYTDPNDLATALSGMYLIAERDTYSDISSTPTQIETLVGKNNLSTPLDGQSIDSVKYREVFAFDDVEKVVSLRVPISMLGTDESGRTTASQSYASGDYFYKDGYMCKALTSISAGATLTLNTNYSQGTLADILKAIENA